MVSNRTSIVIGGWVAPGFERVRDAFIANFLGAVGTRDLGASFAAYRGERLVVDLWGGSRDEGGSVPWSRDTLTNVWSATKGVTAIALAVLVDRGLVSYDAPVARYWPEFGQNGKGEITVSHLLSHQAGLPGFVEPTTAEDLYDWNAIVSRLARQTPMWKPGTKNSYHALTFGFLVGEVIRRVSGVSVGRFVAQEIAGPLAADVFIGLPQVEEARVAPVVPPQLQLDMDLSQLPPEMLIVLTNPGLNPSWPNERAFRAAEIPAGNAQATALGLARLYAMLANGGTFSGVTLMSSSTVRALGAMQTQRTETSLGGPAGWTNGMHANLGGVFGPNPEAFGHVGWGGSFGSVDVQNRIAMGYAINRMGDGNTGDPRATALSTALYACL